MPTGHGITELYNQQDTTMTKQEFEERYGKEVSDHMFDNINALYMGAGDMDKDTFVKDYKKHEESMLLQLYYEKSEDLKRKLTQANQKTAYLLDEMIKSGAEFDSELLEIAENQIGKKNVILRKIALKIELEDDDLEYVSKNLR